MKRVHNRVNSFTFLSFFPCVFVFPFVCHANFHLYFQSDGLSFTVTCINTFSCLLKTFYLYQIQPKVNRTHPAHVSYNTTAQSIFCDIYFKKLLEFYLDSSHCYTIINSFFSNT